MSVEAVAQRFKRAPRAAVADLLATLGQARPRRGGLCDVTEPFR